MMPRPRQETAAEWIWKRVRFPCLRRKHYLSVRACTMRGVEACFDFSKHVYFMLTFGIGDFYENTSFAHIDLSGAVL